MKAAIWAKFWNLEGCNLELLSGPSKGNVRQRQLQAEGLVYSLVAWCFGVAEAKFWRLERNLYTDALSHREVFTHRAFYTKKSLHRVVFTHRFFNTQKFLHREVFAQRRPLHQVTI